MNLGRGLSLHVTRHRAPSNTGWWLLAAALLLAGIAVTCLDQSPQPAHPPSFATARQQERT